MKFHATALLGVLLSSSAMAEEILVRADVTEVTVFFSGLSEFSREVELQIPAGANEILLAVPEGTRLEAAEISATGPAQLGALVIEQGYRIEEGALDLPDQAEARAAVEAVEGEIEALRAEISEAQAAVQAAQLQRRYLESVSADGDNAASFPDDPERLATMLTVIGDQTGRIAEAAREADARQAELNEELGELMQELAQAQSRLQEMAPFGESVTLVRLPVTAPSPTEMTLALSHYDSDFGIEWYPEYRMYLDSDAASLQVQRDILIGHDLPERLIDVALSVSTADPARELEPSGVNPRPARIVEPEARSPQPTVGLMSSMGTGAAANVVLEPVVIAEAAAVASPVGASLTYRFPEAVTLLPGQESRQAMDTLDFEVELENRAVPRHDATAFLVAELENSSGEALLPGYTIFYRDGELLGESRIDLLAAGDSVELAFGALDHLRLEWRDLSRDEGDAGIFTRSDTQAHAVEFSVQNTSGEAQELRLIYATPFSEQEDLEMDLSLSPRADEQDLDGQRGVQAWDLELAPGETETIRMDVEFSWPEGQNLVWRP